jgi:hypothetical protein
MTAERVLLKKLLPRLVLIGSLRMFVVVLKRSGLVGDASLVERSLIAEVSV